MHNRLLRTWLTRRWLHRSLGLAAVLVAALQPAWASRNFTPQAGTWIVSSELNGEPGRGLAIDVQGNTFFMQVFGYEKNGDATFYTATGQMDGTSVTAPLLRWRGGRSFGNDARDGQADGSPGDVTVRFSNGLQGTVQFPGEDPVSMERFLVTKRDDPYYQQGQWTRLNAVRTSQWFVYDEQGKVASAWSAYLRPQPNPGEDFYRLELWNYAPDGGFGYLRCAKPEDTDSYRCTLLDENAAGRNFVKSLELRFVGAQVAGQLTLNKPFANAQPFMGWSTQSLVDPKMPSSGSLENIETFLSDFSSYGTPPKLMPSNGTWVAADELTGKPGRGLSLDVQGDKIVVQVFAYRSNGVPTFYMGSGNYVGGGFGPDAAISGADIAIKRYANGRSFGGVAQSANAVEDAGTVKLQIQQTDQPMLSSGTIQFPAEGPKRVVRMPLSDLTDWQSRMLGQWRLGWSGDLWMKPLVTLNRVDGGEVTNEDGSVRCKPDERLTVVCNWWSADRSKVLDSIKVPLDSPLVVSSRALRLSDQFGNLLGLGDAPMR